MHWEQDDHGVYHLRGLPHGSATIRASSGRYAWDMRVRGEGGEASGSEDSLRLAKAWCEEKARELILGENPLSHRALWALGLAGAGAALGLGVYLATRSTQATVSSVDNSGPTVNNTPQGQVTPSENS